MCLVALCLFPIVTHAQVVFTEVMYDVPGTDTGREWVEVQNNGTDSVDLSTYKLFEANTNHRIEAQGSASLPAGSYAIIADDSSKFKIDYPSYSGLLFSSSFSLSNTGEPLSLKTADGTVADSVSYDVSIGAAGNGKTLQKQNTSWIEGDATPGGPFSGNTPTQDASTTSVDTHSTSTVADSGDNTESVSQVTYSNSTQSTIYTGNDNADLEISGGRDRLVAIGTPLSFEAKIRSPKSVHVAEARFKWSFGDGSSMTGPFASHTYYFPGEYEVVLNGVYQTNEAVARIRVRVVETNIVISSVDGKYVEVENKSKNELNLGGYFIRSGKSQFNVPQDTIILSGKSLKIPTIISKLTIAESIEIKNPLGDIVAQKRLYGAAQEEKSMVSIGMSESEFREKITTALARYDVPVRPVSIASTVKPLQKRKVEQAPPSTEIVRNSSTSPDQVAAVSFVVDRGDGGVISRFMKWMFN
jgi:hypothetical protein